MHRYPRARIALCLLLLLGGCTESPRGTAPHATSVPVASVASAPTIAPDVAPVAAPSSPRDLESAALAADRAGDLEGCMRNEAAALALRESPRVRLHLASCQSRAGKLVAAYANVLTARALGRETGDDALVKVAAARAAELEARLGSIRVQIDAATSATLDGEPITDRVKSLVDPGPHELVVTFGASTQKKTLPIAEGDAVELVADAKAQTVSPAPPRPKRDVFRDTLF